MGDWGDEVKGEEEKKEGKFLPTGGRMDWQASKVEQEFVADLKIVSFHQMRSKLLFSKWV